MASVFIIENDKLLQELYEKILINNGFQVIGKEASGNAAIAKLRSFSEMPDVILMDYRMPKKNGIEITKEILNIDKDARIIIISGDLTIENEVLKEGAKLFLSKPFSYHELVKEINRLSNQFCNTTKVMP